MGLLVNGVWQDKWYDTKKSGGKFIRSEAQFRNIIEDNSNFTPDSGRYHLYVSLACPWAHRTMIYRNLKNLEDHISYSVVNPYMLENGWAFEESYPGATTDHLFSQNYLYQIYLKADPKYSGRVTVPVLWDKKNQTIVSNESSEIIQMFNSEFNTIGHIDYDYYPKNLTAEIDDINDMVYHNVNNGVYKAGFSTSQEAYEEAYDNLFNTFDKMEEILSRQRYLVGNKITVADWRAFPTLFRFDTVYHYAFKCNKKHLYEYPNLWNYTRELYQVPGISKLCWLEAAKSNYWSGSRVNATGTIPKGPEGIDFFAPHDRGRFR